MELTFFQSDTNKEYRNDYAGSDQGLLSSVSPSQKYYLVFVLSSFHYYRQRISFFLYKSYIIYFNGDTQTAPKSVFAAVKWLTCPY